MEMQQITNCHNVDGDRNHRHRSRQDQRYKINDFIKSILIFIVFNQMIQLSLTECKFFCLPSFLLLTK